MTAPRPMLTAPLAAWRSEGGRMWLVRPLGDTPEAWLRWAAVYLDPSLVGVLAAEPVQMWSNIGGVLRLSVRRAQNYAEHGEFVFAKDGYRTWTTLRELWDAWKRLRGHELRPVA